MATTRAPALGVLGGHAPARLVGRGLRRFLRGGRMESVAAAPGGLVVSLARRGAAVFGALRDDEGGALLRVERVPGGAAGGGLYPELAGRRIVRVRDGRDCVELHFGDGSTLRLCAVVDGGGCRTATVRRRLARDRGSFLLDRALGRLLQPVPPGALGPKPSAGAGSY